MIIEKAEKTLQPRRGDMGYLPDWSSPSRVFYTHDLIRILTRYFTRRGNWYNINSIMPLWEICEKIFRSVFHC
ncbi:MAG: hypothetical protein DWB56_08285 [Candidatus Jettenia sp.]|uniref:Uncharacterized protein n=1 Tax=Candidatus Jettenia caeni TaxID=247490 RepID=I3IQ00_9BACT|nr:hypothetical protein [Candidatus Jettenia sp. AMX1]MBC6928944.1 hypothetical protein [Candidatus Jettenia sp.]NUN24829.1 hypothetical protein [Candidatus Jettenia caeni]KAA0250387.1 MAG: hypothetical protein EDM77_05505 [Candidatus Jettenia sp. AMX1]MCE7880921.1 hypothetical protein [Candidatus Jettenia sp. AMX1]MCQ3927011.1 hypothetical protein [Candidatus Jettenia sp.]